MKESWIKIFGSLIGIIILIIAVSIIFLENKLGFAFAFLVLGLIFLVMIRIFGIKIKSIYPNLIFGFIDDSLLVLTSTIGGLTAGVGGAIIGGAAGNAITDAIGGLFEGKIAEKMKKEKIKENRSAIATMFGKVTGCLFGAGVMILIIWILRRIFNI